MTALESMSDVCPDCLREDCACYCEECREDLVDCVCCDECGGVIGDSCECEGE